MILRFTSERHMEATYASWRLNKAASFSIIAVTKTRVARITMPTWFAYIENKPRLKEFFELEVMRIMSSIMSHTIMLHLLDAPGRVHRFLRKHPELFDRMPKKELASYLNLSPETLSRLKNQGKI
jgi:CRP-like cAMP-binding protein